MTIPQSAQQFVRTLKAPSDPPIVNGPLKIDIAERAWHDPSFHLPNKAEFIADWLLSKFFRERGNEFSSSPLANERYWRLLSNILTSNDPSTRTPSNTHTKSWIKPMLSRIAIVPIIVAFLNLWSQLKSSPSSQLIAHAFHCISILYPIGTQKMTTEALLEPWGAFLKNSGKLIDQAYAIKIGLVLTQVYGDSLANSTNQKKVNAIFVQNNLHLESWLERLNTSSGDAQHQYLRSAILSSGVATIFNVDTLRPLSESPETTPLFHALAAALGNHRTVVLKALPRLFAHYVASLKKHRAIIIGATATSRQDLNAACMRFFTSCQNLLDTQTRDVEVWDAMAESVEIVRRESLFDSESDAALSLNANVEMSLECLSDDGTKTTTSAITRCLSAITRVDYDLVLPSMGKIFSRLLAIPRIHPDHFVLLDLLLEYHVKTRTVNQYIETFFSCLSPKSTSSPHSTYAIANSSPLLHPKHLEKLSKATQQFLNPSQCNSTVEYVCETLKAMKDQHKSAERRVDANQGKGSRKSRESDAMAVDQPESAAWALSFALSSKLAQTVLGHLPISYVPQEQAEQLKAFIAEFHADFVNYNLSKLLKTFGKSEDAMEVDDGRKSLKRKEEVGEESTWGTQIMLVSLLRLRYALRMTKSLHLSPNDASKLPKRLLGVMGKVDDELLPELSLEIFRALFEHASVMDESKVREAIDFALQFLERRLSTSVDVAWSGFPHELTFGQPGQAQSSLALLHLILERWLPVIDSVASTEQLEKLTQIITRIPMEIADPAREYDQQHLVASQLLFRTLRSAQFWELHNLRSCLLAHLVRPAPSADEEKLSKESPKKSKKQTKSSVDGVEVSSTYRLLLFFPVEYFTKPCRAELLKRAIKADWDLSKERGAQSCAGLLTLRTFLKKTFSFINSIEYQTAGDIADFSLHLLEDIPGAEGQTEYANTTLDLWELYTTELFKQSIRGDAGEASKVLSSYLQYPIFDDFSSIKARSLVSLVNLLNNELAFSSFSADIQMALQGLHSNLTKTLQDKFIGVLMDSNQESSVPHMLTYWHALLSLGHWLGVKALSSYFGVQLVQKFSLQFFSSQQSPSNDWVDNTAVMIVAILLQELHYRDEVTLNSQLDSVVAAYVSYRRCLSPSGQTQLDDFVSKSCRQLSPTNFEHMLGLVEEALLDNSGLSALSIDLVHLEAMFLGSHPSSTLRITQASFTRCVDIFTGNDEFINGSVELRLEALSLVAQHCSERPAALRSLDIGNIWSLLSKNLAPSPKRDKSTSAVIFHKIAAVVGAVIRLRRDLATPMLPHLGMILRQLILSMRKCRPQLASKQTEMVMITLPRWISADQSLGVDEARSLSRVLETLTAKTTTRVHTTHSEAQKAESLAIPFSKHAAYVLKAYIEAMNDPLCVITLDVRKELYPGLYALCSMIGEHSRDALMVSGLDAGGKATIKALWKDYEKQKYIGKG